MPRDIDVVAWSHLAMFRVLILALWLASSSTAQAQTFPVARCINLSNAFEAPNEGDWGYVIERLHLADIADAGFDTVRLPIKVSGHLQNGKIDPAFLARIDDVIMWAFAQNLTVIIDVHHFDEIMQDPARHRETLVSIWDQLSLHYAGYPPTLMFELLNEPNGALSTNIMIDLNNTIIERIRPRHPDRWIITGGGDWNALAALPEMPPPRPFEARTFHYYAPFDFTHQLAPWTEMDFPARGWGTEADRTELATDIASAAAPYPVFLGEFGVYRGADPQARIAWTRATRTAAEGAGIAWCYWGLAADFRIYDAVTRTWDEPLLRALMD